MANRRKPRYVSGWVSEQQYAKLASLASLKGSSVNGVICELVDAVGIEIVMPQNAKNDAGRNRQEVANAVLS